MPVVDEWGHLVGVVGPTRLICIMRREHSEDLYRLTTIVQDVLSLVIYFGFVSAIVL